MARFLFQDKYNSTHAFYKLFAHKKREPILAFYSCTTGIC